MSFRVLSANHTSFTVSSLDKTVYLQYGASSDLRLPRGFVVDGAADYVTEVQLPVD
jgi:hypothetical protein